MDLSKLCPTTPLPGKVGIWTLQISNASHVGHHNQSNPHPVPTLKMGLDLGIWLVVIEHAHDLMALNDQIPHLWGIYSCQN